MLYAKIVLGLAVKGPFDYIVPDEVAARLKAGSRVKVNFCNRVVTGYIVEIAKKSKVKNLKSILTLIDEVPVLSANILELTKEIADYYFCFWGEVIETALPEGLRKGKKIVINEPQVAKLASLENAVTLLHDLDGQARWDIYIKEIKTILGKLKQAVLIMPDVESVLRAKKIIEEKIDCSVGLMYRSQPKELGEWEKIKNGEVSLVIGTRSAIFAPLPALALVIIDDEHNPVYKQDQVPHYHVREVAFMRNRIDKLKVILGSSTPSLESVYLARQKKIGLELLPRIKKYPEIKILKMRGLPNLDKKNRLILSRSLIDAMTESLNNKGKILVFMNRHGFATYAYCHSCGKSLSCPRCNVNLVFHFSGKMLVCHRCNFKMKLPDICPVCNSGYIKYSGLGTEKVESELARLFPQAKVKIIDEQPGLNQADIFISTESIIGKISPDLDLVVVLAIDGTLNRVDFRASEKAFILLSGLARLTQKKMIIQTSLASHYVFKAIETNQPDKFFDRELKERKQLGLPPLKHNCLIKLRAKNEDKVREASQDLFNKLTLKKTRGIDVVANTPGQPLKLRGNFYWQILLKSSSVLVVDKFLKIHLKDFRHSGIIVTIDMDPL